MPRPADSNPRVTAVMPVKEFHEDYLRRALDSILGQTAPMWRLLIVVESPPTDALAAVLGPALEDDRVTLVLNEGRKLSGAINTGMRHARTPYVAILLGDDMWAPDAVEVLTARIDESPHVDFFYSSRVIVDGDDRPISPVYPARTRFSVSDFERGSPVKHLLCWRRDAALRIGGLDESLNSVGPDDYDFPWSMAEAGMRFEPVPECLYLYRDHRDGFRLTTHLPRSTHTRELRRIFRKHGVGVLGVERAVWRAKVGYLKQCLYRSPLDRWLKSRIGHDPHRGWRQKYR